MALSNVQLYESLKGSIPDEAARMIAEAFPAARDLATKLDVHEVKVAVTQLEARMEALHASTLRWMVGLFFPAWAVTAGTLLALVLRA